jgi:hypothetical protein
VKTIHHVIDVDAGHQRSGRHSPKNAVAGWRSTVVRATGEDIEWTFAGDFNPVMQITALDPPRTLAWRCVSGHDPWLDNDFRFELELLDGGHTRMRFWQEYATELSDDAYGTYNFNWGYYLESLRLLHRAGSPTRTGHDLRTARRWTSQLAFTGGHRVSRSPDAT